MLKDWPIALTYYYLTALVVAGGATAGFSLFQPCREHPSAKHDSLLDGFFAWDGEWYERIATEGYSYSPKRQSSVAFYPGYPLAAARLSRLTGIAARPALLIVTHASLIGAFLLLAVYVQERYAEAGADAVDYTLLAFGLLPTTYFFRMAYSESLFVLSLLAAMLAMQRGCRAVYVALIVGAATACRSVGVALLPPLAMYVWSRARSPARAVAQGAVLLPLACWGLLAWMAFQWVAFDDPLAFVQTQRHWSTRQTSLLSWDGLTALVTLRPIRSVYDPASPCYWGNFPPRGNPLFNLMFANPIWFLVAVTLVTLGRAKGWLSNRETALAAGLLLIPYVLQADRACMAAEARYASSVFPAYLVLGQILSRLPGPLAAVLLAMSAVMLAFYTAMFVSWYWFY